MRKLPFRTFDYPGEVHPGLRAYPFLAQVSCHPRCCGVAWHCLLLCPACLPVMQSPARARAAYQCSGSAVSLGCRRKPGCDIPPDVALCLPLQVCRHWKSVLEGPTALQALWGELVVDFGHELITGGGGRCWWGMHQGADLHRRCSTAGSAACPPALPACLQGCTCRWPGRMCGPLTRSSARPLPLCACAATASSTL